MVAAVGVAAPAISGGSGADPRTPPGLPGKAPPFLGTAVVGGGRLTAAVDSYGDVVDLRVPGPAGRALIENSAARQVAGTVPADTGIVPRVSIGGSHALPLWRATWVRQTYLPGTNVLRTVAWIGSARVEITYAARGETLAQVIKVSPGWERGAAVHRTINAVADRINVELDDGLRCNQARWRRRVFLVCSVGRAEATAAPQIVRAAVEEDRGWVGHARPLGPGAPGWARQMYERSLLVLRALSDGQTGAVVAGLRDGWAYVWPRDASAVAIALASAGYRPEASRVARFLLGLDLASAARFRGTGEPVGGRAAQGDACGWVAAAARATGAGLDGRSPPLPQLPRGCTTRWRSRPDYQEGDPGDYLANAVAAASTTAIDGPKTSLYDTKSARRAEIGGIRRGFGTSSGMLARRAGDPGSGLDAAAAWAIRPFSLQPLYPLARRTLLRLAARSPRFGTVPSEDWSGGNDPWTAPTAWSAWSLATLARGAPGREDASRRDTYAVRENSTARRNTPMDLRASSAAGRLDRRAALRLLGALRRAATPAGLLPERVDAGTGVPRSTTPLAWSHAFAILALRQLWPTR
ncbi:MAG: glycoside hydrolase family 15 protein [Solirubrobacterales bacterium]